jgi:hypothetical protein
MKEIFFDFEFDEDLYVDLNTILIEIQINESKNWEKVNFEYKEDFQAISIYQIDENIEKFKIRLPFGFAKDHKISQILVGSQEDLIYKCFKSYKNSENGTFERDGNTLDYLFIEVNQYEIEFVTNQIQSLTKCGKLSLGLFYSYKNC